MQPAYICINACLDVYSGNKDSSELFVTILSLFSGSVLCLSLQYSWAVVLVGAVLSYAQNHLQTMTVSDKKNGTKLNSYSSAGALAISAVYCAWKGNSSGGLQTLGISLVSGTFVGALALYPKEEQQRHLGYLGVFFSACKYLAAPAYLCLYIVNNTFIVFLEYYRVEAPDLEKTPQSLFHHIFMHKDSRRLSLFLFINLLFMFVEALYGYLSNSLGLISDSIHMAFDCTALAIGLYASYVSKFPPDKEHPYGYHRYEVLSGFVNAVFLIFVGMSVFEESVERIMSPPEINTDMLMLVSVLGLVVNLIGLFFFQDSHGDNSNLEGVFLHILADTLGSVGVIVSSLMVEAWEWYIADPICSLVISVLIFMSVLPLLSESLKSLLERDTEKQGKQFKKQISEVEGVDFIEKIFVWKLAAGEDAAMVWVKAKEGADVIKVTEQCKALLPSWNAVQVN